MQIELPIIICFLALKDDYQLPFVPGCLLKRASVWMRQQTTSDVAGAWMRCPAPTSQYFLNFWDKSGSLAHVSLRDDANASIHALTSSFLRTTVRYVLRAVC
eukprot:3417444-Amphidinium_carterae.1